MGQPAGDGLAGLVGDVVAGEVPDVVLSPGVEVSLVDGVLDDPVGAFVAGSGGVRVAAIRDWIFNHLTYRSGSSSATTTALDSFVREKL